MNTTSSKVFSVFVLACADLPHAEKIAEQLRASFSHRVIRIVPEGSSLAFNAMLKAESPAEIRAAISPALGGATCVCGEMSFLGPSGVLSPVPPDFMHFVPPVKKIGRA